MLTALLQCLAVCAYLIVLLLRMPRLSESFKPSVFSSNLSEYLSVFSTDISIQRFDVPEDERLRT